MQLKIKLSADRYAGRPKAQKYLLTGRAYCGKCGSLLNGETKRDHPERPLRPIYRCRVQGDTQREGGCGGVTVNASALNWYIRESVFDHINPEAVAELLRYDESGDAKLKQLLPLLDRSGMIWISWPKRASKVTTDITEDAIRDVCLPMHLVDVKVCSVDDIWSGLKLVIRKLIGWYVRFLGQQVSLLGQAAARLGLMVADRLDQFEAEQGAERAALAAQVAALEARVAELEARP